MLHVSQLQARGTQQERTELRGHRGDNCHVRSLTLSRVCLPLGFHDDQLMQLWGALVSRTDFKS